MTAPFLGSESDLSRATLRGKGYERLTRDVYVLTGGRQDLRARAEAGVALFPDAVPCLFTSAVLLRLPADDDGIVHLARGEAAPRTQRAGFRTHRFTIPEARTHDLDGLRVADGPRCFADLSAHLELEALVALGDVVARRWGTDDIADAVAEHGRRPGAVLLRQAVPLLDAGSDSPAETRARLRLHAAGFTALRHKVHILDAAHEWLATADLGDPEAKVAVQHEGLVHFQKGARQRRQDADRDELSREQDWEVVISTAIDDAQPHRLVRKVTNAYSRAAVKWGRQVLPPHMR